MCFEYTKGFRQTLFSNDYIFERLKYYIWCQQDAGRTNHQRQILPLDPPGSSWGIPRPGEINNPSSGFFGVCPKDLLSVGCSKTASRGTHPCRRDPDNMPEPQQLNPFNPMEQQFYSKIPIKVRASLTEREANFNPCISDLNLFLAKWCSDVFVKMFHN